MPSVVVPQVALLESLAVNLRAAGSYPELLIRVLTPWKPASGLILSVKEEEPGSKRQ